MNLFVGNIQGENAYLNEEESHHCTKVLRKSVGDEITVTDGVGKTIIGTISKAGKKEVIVSVESDIDLPSISTGLHLAVAPTKNLDRFEFMIEKATELGASQLTPIICHHSERTKFNLDKIQKKAIAANKQSLRSNFLIVNPPQKLSAFLNSTKESSVYIAHCNTNMERKAIQKIDFQENPVVLIGPEGDFSTQEILDISSQSNTQAISLGPNRLRTETAGIYVASFFYSLINEQ